MGYNSVIKREWKFAICNNMDELGGYYAKWNKSEKNKYCIISIIFGTLKVKHSIITIQTQTYRYRE